MQETWQAIDPVVAIGSAAEAMAVRRRGNWISFWICLALVAADGPALGRAAARPATSCTIGRREIIRLPAIDLATARDPIGQAAATLQVRAIAHRRFPRDRAAAKESALAGPVKELAVDQADLVTVTVRIDRAMATAICQTARAKEVAENSGSRATAIDRGDPAMAIVRSDRATMAGPITAPAMSTIGISGTTTVTTTS